MEQNGNRQFPRGAIPTFVSRDHSPGGYLYQRPTGGQLNQRPTQDPCPETLVSALANLNLWNLDNPAHGYGLNERETSPLVLPDIDRTEYFARSWDGVDLLSSNGVDGTRGFDLENWNCYDFGSHSLSSVWERGLNWNRYLRNNDVSVMPTPNQNGVFRGPHGSVSGPISINESVIKHRTNNRRQHWPQELLSSNDWSLDDLQGCVVPLSKHQSGCRFLQTVLNNKTEGAIETVFLEVINSVEELMTDPVGNFAIQELVEVCNEEQRTRILLMVTKNQFQLVRICLNPHGTRVVQRLLKHITTRRQLSIVMRALNPGAAALSKDINGYRVIQHCVEHFSNEDNRVLLSNVTANCFAIATTQNGCCVLQKCVDHAEGEIRDHLVNEIIANALLLAEDQFGNYVVQHILGLRIPHISANVLRQLKGNYTSLSFNKYGSNVVEKCINETGEEHSAMIIMELLRDPNVSMLLVDQYGNFVVQSALKESKARLPRLYYALEDLIRRNAPLLRSNMFGQKVLAWFNRRRL